MIYVTLTVFNYDNCGNPRHFYVTHFRHNLKYSKKHYQIRQRYPKLLSKAIKDWTYVNNETTIYMLPGEFLLSSLIFCNTLDNHYRIEPRSPMVRMI